MFRQQLQRKAIVHNGIQRMFSHGTSVCKIKGLSGSRKRTDFLIHPILLGPPSVGFAKIYRL